jgi:hypothetical protein
MNTTMFPKMLSSHDAGWEWLMRVHPSVPRVFLLYVMPLALIPPLMILYAVRAYGEHLLGGIGIGQAWKIATFFYACELVAVPVMAVVIRRLGEVVGARPEYHDVFAYAAVVPTPLWLSSLVLFVPSLVLAGLAMALALLVSGLLIYEGNYRVFQLNDEGKSKLLAGAILGAGLVGWVVMVLVGFVSWGWVVS